MLTIISQFSTTLGAVGLGYDPAGGQILVYGTGATVSRFATDGTSLGSFANPGEAADDFDIDFAGAALMLGSVEVPAGAALLINGESGTADIRAVDPVTGAVIATLVTGFGDGHVVGGSWHAARGTIFLVQDRVPGAAGNRIAEIDPATGAVLNSFAVDPGGDFTVNYGDLDVDPATGDLIVVSSDETSLLRLAPDGTRIETIALPPIGGLSGIAFVPGTGQLYAVNTAGTVFLLDGLGADVLTGGPGDDLLEGGAGNDILSGAAGNDIIDGGSGNDLLDGGTGTDTLRYAGASAGVTVSLALTGAQDTGGAGIDTIRNFEKLTGSAFDDVLTGSSGNLRNMIDGGGGNDLIDGGAGTGPDTLIGGDGIDTVTYAAAAARVNVNLGLTTQQSTIGGGLDTLSGFENAIGSAFNDIITGSQADNVLTGGAGNDVLAGLAGNDTLLGGDGNDMLSGGDGDDRLDGGAGTDIASYAGAGSAVTVSLLVAGAQDTGGGGTDRLTAIEGLVGSAFNDLLIGDAGNNSLSGGGGSDVIAGDPGTDVIDGGSGIDTLDYSAVAAGVTVNLISQSAQNTGGAGTDTILGIENVIGTAFNDVLTGNEFANLLTGGDGDDMLVGGPGNDTLNGGAGSDTASYAAAANAVKVSLALSVAQTTGLGSDTLIGIENITGSAFDDVLTGNTGDNVLIGNAGNDMLVGALGNDTLSGGAGTDTASYAGILGSVTVNLALTGAQDTGAAGIDTLSSIENLVGTTRNDVLTGNAQNNRIEGGGGDDMIDGGSGNDTLDGGGGNDLVRGGAGNDMLFAGTGNDIVDGGSGVDTISYAAALLNITVDLGLTTAQSIGGGQGVDTLTNIENVVGSAYDDVLIGSAADNALTGGGGKDVLTGGAGNDSFVFLAINDSRTTNADLITDFTLGDILDLSAIDANTRTPDANDAFVRVDGFTKVGGQFILTYDAGTDSTTLLADTDANGIGDFSILFTGDVTALTGSWVL